MRIKAKQTHIDNGTPGDDCRCALVLAIREALNAPPEVRIQVCETEEDAYGVAKYEAIISIWVDTPQQTVRKEVFSSGAFTKKANEFVRLFDDPDKDVEPFSFNIPTLNKKLFEELIHERV